MCGRTDVFEMRPLDGSCKTSVLPLSCQRLCVEDIDNCEKQREPRNLLSTPSVHSMLSSDMVVIVMVKLMMYLILVDIMQSLGTVVSDAPVTSYRKPVLTN